MPLMTFDEVVAQVQALTPADLEAWIAQRWVEPAADVEKPGGRPLFREVDVARVRLIAEIRYEFGVTDDALELFLSVLDQSHDLRRRLRLLEAAIKAQPAETRAAINRTLREIVGR
ncbi:MAG: hypothetical protein D6763_07885 [Alphaproteobacteria bacterium]|nr:MAG: hypothetical protein D6763_07885 [Alphaproteobacteria bacterium]